MRSFALLFSVLAQVKSQKERLRCGVFFCGPPAMGEAVKSHCLLSSASSKKDRTLPWEEAPASASAPAGAASDDTEESQSSSLRSPSLRSYSSMRSRVVFEFHKEIFH